MVRYYTTPFAATGDKTAVPDGTQTDGSVSYTSGYGMDYELPRSTNPAALNIERQKFNELMFDVTQNIQQYQQNGIPNFITSSDNGGTAYMYAKGAMVRYNNGTSTDVYMSLTDSNNVLPTNTSGWVLISGLIAAAQAQANIATAASAYQYTYLTTTTNADPGSGNLAFNAALSSATALYISETSALAQNLAPVLVSWTGSTNTVKGQIKMLKRADPTVFALFNISGTLTDNGTWDTLTVAYVAGNGSFANNDSVSLNFSRTGDVGATGPSGSVADGNKGDITVSGSGTAFTINPAVVTPAKVQNVSATQRILGRKSTGAGSYEECQLTDILDFVGSAAQGDILYRGASSWTRLAAGTAGNFLQTQGSGANPQWAGASSQVVLLGTATASSSATVNFLSLITSAYDEYFFVLKNVVLSSTSVNLLLQGSANNGSTWFSSSSYFCYDLTINMSTLTSSTNISNTTGIIVNSVGSNVGITSMIRMHGPLNLNNAPSFDCVTMNPSTIGNKYYDVLYGFLSGTTINAVRFIPNGAATITSGTIQLFGIKNS